MRKRLVIATVAIVGFATLAVPTTASAADPGGRLGVIGQECAARYGFDTLGSSHLYLVKNYEPRLAGAPFGLTAFCGWTR